MSHRNATRIGRLAAAAVCVGAAVLAGAPAASADTTSSIAFQQGKPGELTLLFSVDGLGSNVAVDPATVKLQIDGKDLDGVKADRAGTSAAVTLDRTAVLAMDVSGSMKADNKIQGAKAAANTFLAGLPADVKVGLVTFSDSVQTPVAPTADRARVRSAINALQANGGTKLNDGVIRAVTVAGTQGARSVVLLSDGADDKTGSSAAAARQAVVRSKIPVNAVAFGKDADIGQLRYLAAGGQVRNAADAGALASFFKQQAEAISNQILVTAPLPAEYANKSGNVTVTAKAGDQQVSQTAFVSFAGLGGAQPTNTAEAYGPTPVESSSSPITRTVMLVALAAVFLGLLVLLAVAFSSVRTKDSKEGRVRRRLSIYTLTGRAPVKQQETTALGDSNVARSAVEFAGKVVARRDFEEVLGLRLEAAGVPLRAAEWLLIHVGLTLGVGLLFLLIFGGSLVPALIGIALGFLAPWLYLSFKETRRLNAFLAQLPDTLQLLAGSLSAGYSLPQAVDTVVREGQAPITTEFNRALVEARLGVPLEDALDNVATRMKSKDFAWVVMAIRIQREVGGNLAEVLTTVSGTLRERERLRRQVQVLSAEGRLSAWILGGLPIMFAIYLVLVRREYLRPLYTELIGYILIIMGVTFLLVGTLWLRKVVKVEV